MESIPVDFAHVRQKNVLAEGPSTLASEYGAIHPVQAVLRKTAQTEREMRRQIVGNSFGTHMLVREAIEDAILSQPLRLPGLHSSRIGLSALRGTDTQLGFGDILSSFIFILLFTPDSFCRVLCTYLWLVDPREYEIQIDVHSAMERRLGMSDPALRM